MSKGKGNIEREWLVNHCCVTAWGIRALELVSRLPRRKKRVKGICDEGASLCVCVCFLFLNLFLAVLGLCCCERAFSSLSKQGLLFVAELGL